MDIDAYILNVTSESKQTSVKQLLDICQKLVEEGKGDYIVSCDGYEEIDFEVQDYSKRLWLW